MPSASPTIAEGVVDQRRLRSFEKSVDNTPTTLIVIQ